MSSENSNPPSEQSEAPRWNILVADDTDMNLSLTSRLLSRRGHTVVAVEDGFQAYQAFQKERFDVVLMDVQMPVMDGMDATRKIRLWEKEQFKKNPSAPRKRVPVIALTANDDRSFIDTCLQAGMDDVIPKPMEMKTLMATIQSIMENAEPV